MPVRPLLLLLVLAGAACSTQPLRLNLLREADPGTAERAAYERVEEAVDLANAFLHESPYAQGFPAEQAEFWIGTSTVMLRLKNEGVHPVSIRTAGWGDPRTVVGDGLHPDRHGFLARRETGQEATGDPTMDNAFLAMSSQQMAGVLLRQATLMREMQERGTFDYWINYDLLGLDPDLGWGPDSPVNRRAYAVERGFWAWLEGGDAADEADAADAAGDEG